MRPISHNAQNYKAQTTKIVIPILCRFHISTQFIVLYKQKNLTVLCEIQPVYHTEKRLQNLSSTSYHFSPKKKVVVWKNREDRSVNWFSCDTFNNKKRDLSIILYRRMHLLPKTAWYTLFSSVMTMKDDVKALWQASETSSFSWSSEETSMANVRTLEYSIGLSENWSIRKMAYILFRTR